MLKRLSLLLLLCLLVAKGAIGQAPGYELNERFAKGSFQYTPVMFYTESKYYDARHLPQLLAIEVADAKAVQNIINAKLQDRVYAVSIRNKDTLDLRAVFISLQRLKNLKFVKIDDIGFLNIAKKERYRLPAEIESLKQLIGVDLCYTLNIDMADAVHRLSALKNLQVLSMAGYTAALPAEIASFKNVKTVRLSATSLEGIPPADVTWNKIYLEGSAPRAGPDEKALRMLAKVKSLRHLDLSFCMLGDASCLTGLKQLETLSVSSSQTDKSVNLISKIAGLTNLRGLSVWANNNIGDLQTISGIDSLKNLVSLEINGMGSLGKQPARLKLLSGLIKLESLTLQSDSIATLVDVFDGLTQLKKINVSENQLKELPAALFNLPRLEYLDVTANQLKSLPAGRYNCTGLKKLDAGYNAINALPPVITTLKNLQYLQAPYNKIAQLPAGWQLMTALAELDLSGNQISRFPEGLQQLAGIKKINLSTNNIRAFPPLLNLPYKLTSLKLSNNMFTSLPENFGNFKELDTLLIDGNSLGSLPYSLGNCKKLKHLDAHSESRRMLYGAGKQGNEKFVLVSDSTRGHNNIAALPPGLQAAASLEELQLAGNPNIKGASVFRVILSTPRKYFSVNLDGDNLHSVPGDIRWKTLTFDQLNLNNNKLTSLPVVFASIKHFNNVTVNNNPIRIDPAICNRPIVNAADMKILFDEMGIALPKDQARANDYAISLAERISDYYNKNKWQKAVEYARKAIIADSIAYNNAVSWDEIGICRFNLKDYNGAINDFNHFIAKEAKTHVHWQASLSLVEQYKANGHIALGQKQKAAETHEYFGNHYGNMSALQEAAIIYREIGNKEKARQLLDTALTNYALRYQEYKKSGYTDPSFILDYAELLIITGKAAEATKILNSQQEGFFSKENTPIKNYLLATAAYLNNPPDFDAIKITLGNEAKNTGKISGWSFDMFNSWLATADSPATDKDHLLALQNIAK